MKILLIKNTRKKLAFQLRKGTKKNEKKDTNNSNFCNNKYFIQYVYKFIQL